MRIITLSEQLAMAKKLPEVRALVGAANVASELLAKLSGSIPIRQGIAAGLVATMLMESVAPFEENK